MKPKKSIINKPSKTAVGELKKMTDEAMLVKFFEILREIDRRHNRSSQNN